LALQRRPTSDSSRSARFASARLNLAVLKLKKKSTRKRLSDEQIDKIVESQAANDSAWGKPINVRKITPAALSLPSDLTVRNALLASLHKEKNVEK
jgi:hypothetical protein